MRSFCKLRIVSLQLFIRCRERKAGIPELGQFQCEEFCHKPKEQLGQFASRFDENRINGWHSDRLSIPELGHFVKSFAKHRMNSS